jgi:hypothetical protein
MAWLNLRRPHHGNRFAEGPRRLCPERTLKTSAEDPERLRGARQLLADLVPNANVQRYLRIGSNRFFALHLCQSQAFRADTSTGSRVVRSGSLRLLGLCHQCALHGEGFDRRAI